MTTPPFPTGAEDLLARMVAFPTVNPALGGPVGGESQLAANLEAMARSWGLITRRGPVGATGAFNLLVTAPVLAGAEWVMFESHLDTVGVEGMSVPPFQLTAGDDRLYGRGACDTKGSGAAMLWALKTFAGDPDRRRNAGIAFVVDEEAGMTGAQAFAASELRALPRLRGIIVGEPTRLRPVTAHNGAVRWRSITRGVAAHSSDPTLGRSAISGMLRVVAALEEKFIPLATATHPLTGRAAASINVIRGGSAVNIIPDHCEILCDRRIVPGESPAVVLAQRDAAVAGLEVEHDRVDIAPPLAPEAAAPLFQWIQPALTAAGLRSDATGAPYATDGGHYAAAGAPTIVLGPGDIAQAHTRDEWLDRGELNRAVALYLAILRLPA
ncbi:MAG TPA: M20 family metallopeptidase [Opitutaceae bacterium]|nr:M20 family metallopeptidase [Opitutaceae bacterium]